MSSVVCTVACACVREGPVEVLKVLRGGGGAQQGRGEQGESNGTGEDQSLPMSFVTSQAGWVYKGAVSRITAQQGTHKNSHISCSMALTVSIILACVGAALASHPSYGHAPVYGHHHHHKHAYCDPTAAPACAANSTLSYCLEDAEYPEYDIKGAISADHIFAKKYADVADQSADDLVDHVTKYQEEAFDYSYYTGVSTGYSPYDVTHWTGPEGYICPSDVAYARPRRARNVEGKWRVIVNDVHYYTQTARLETCLFPEAACRALAPCYKSHCTQKYVYHRLLSYDPCDPYKGLFIDIYKLPSACSCHLPA